MLGFGVERGRVVLDDAHLLLAFGVLHRGHRLPGELLYAVQRVPVGPAAGMMDEDLAQRGVALARLLEIRVAHARILRARMLRCNRTSSVERSRHATARRCSTTNLRGGLARPLAIEQAREVLEREKVHVDAREPASAHQVLE